MYKLLSSLSPEIEVLSSSLVEGRTYYLVLEKPRDSLVSQVLRGSALSRHIKWHPGNGVAELRIDQFIGRLRIFDREYDVRSEKFSQGLTGDEQIKLIVSELDAISKNISFNYNSSIFAYTRTDWERSQDDYIYRLNYLYSRFFPHGESRVGVFLDFLAIKRDVFLSYSHEPIRKEVWKINSVTPSVVSQLVRAGAVSDGKINYFANRVLCDKTVLSKNNLENQFVRFFFEYCMNVASHVMGYPDISPAILDRAQMLLSESRKFLCDEFFVGIDFPSSIPTNSTVLMRRLGYREIYQLYITSFFSLRHIYEDVVSGFEGWLKDVSALYEVWCFYKIACGILGDRISVSEKGSSQENGTFKYCATFENEKYSVSYNKTFSVGNKGSYSTMLRPDITVRCKRKEKYYHFDAKYRVAGPVGGFDGESRKYRSDDVNKMHAYLDAIYGSSSSVVLYPGDVYQFFVRREPPCVVSDVDEPHPLNGVGALPLVPGSENQVFSRFIGRHFSN